MTPAIELKGIDKRFGAVHANKAVDLVVKKGAIHGIVGENGAGKSTLMSILYGFYEADAGDILVHGRKLRIRSSSEAIGAGIGMVHQHFMLVEPLSVLDNVMLGVEGGALLAKGQTRLRAELARLGQDYGLVIDPDAIVGDLSVGLQQRVEILKALTRGAHILILDEPTAVLTPSEADALFDLLRALSAQGKTVILITHKLYEIMEVTTQVSVMRAGAMVGTVDTAGTSPAALAEMMVGRHVLMSVEKQAQQAGAPLLQVDGLGFVDKVGVTRLADVSFELRAGEIVGLAGVSGNGQSLLLEILSGMTAPTSGTIRVEGRTLSANERTPSALRELGLMHVPEDRQHTGLVMPFAEMESAILGYQDDPALASGPFLSPAMVEARARREIEKYDIRPPNPFLKTANFSGGNQQKIVLAREIERSPKVLLVGQPTRGVDIGAIEFIHKRLIALRDAGVAILLVSVELDEIMSLSDRILVICGGRITGERRPEATNARDLGLLMAGVSERAA